MTHILDRRPAPAPFWAVALGLVITAVGPARRRFDRPPPDRHPERAAPIGRKPHEDAPPRAAGEPGRGRAADGPHEIPRRGWKDILLRIYHGISEDRLVAIAAGATFFILLAIFPAIAGFVSLYGLFADPAAIGQHLDAAAGIMPDGGLSILREQVERLTSQPPQRLGFALLTALAISLWSANGGMKAVFDALNVIYGEKEKRGFLELNALSLAFTLGALVFMLTALATITLLPAVLERIGLSGATELLLKIARWPVLLIVVSFAIALIYRFGPSRDKPQWRWISPGSVFAAVGWLAASLLFSWYAENFGSYNKTYGSLGAAIGFMTWLWLSTIVILVGGKLNAEIEHQTARDTTEGRPEPLGRRGAHMADTVGEAAGG